MGHFAKIDENNIVTAVIVVNNETLENLQFPDSEPVGISFLHQLFNDTDNWKQTSYNNNFRKKFASIGMIYRADIDAFIFPQPYPSWTLDENADWKSPVPYPNDGKQYSWNEETQSWVEITGA